MDVIFLSMLVGSCRLDPGRFSGSKKSQERSRSVQEGPGAARRSPGTPRSSSEVTRMSSRKIGKMSSEMRLAASERRSIAQIGSLARRKNLRFPAFRLGRRVLRFLVRAGG